MRTGCFGLALLACSGAASAGDLPDARYADGNDYAGRVYYSLDFGGAAARAHSVGLRFDNMVTAHQGAPALFQASYSGAGVPSVKLMGSDLRGMVLATSETEGGRGGIMGLSPGQIAGLAFTTLVFAGIAIEAVDGTKEPVGTGGS
ncbi:MAG TPA: hypothetical protein VM240_04835 [Verrucomicrobiae bacterium]|nr:hypothetical protein [Verrucomicrobiae bacterium]